MEMYRPTVRYSDMYRDYINALFQVTTLDRNQILRLALHVASHSADFKQILTKYKTDDVPLPLPNWRLDSHGLWLENNQKTAEGGKHVNVIYSGSRTDTRNSKIDSSRGVEEEKHKSGREQPIKGREGQIPTQRIQFSNRGGITIRIGEETSESY